MTTEAINEKIIEFFCREYQTVWLIDAHDFSLKTFAADEGKSVPKSIDTARAINSYDNARKWYIENYVIEQNRSRMLIQTSIERIIEGTADGKTYNVEYNRISKDKINYNQLCYGRINNEEGNAEYFIMGFRDIDVRKTNDIDDLTGLYTRQAFFRKAEELIKSHPDYDYDIVMSDIADFKNINETYGITVADEILSWVGKYLSPFITEDVLIGRYGGDQMVMIGRHEDICPYSYGKGLEEYLAAEKVNGLPSIITKFGIYEKIRHDRSIVANCDKAHIAINSIKGHYEKMTAFYSKDLKKSFEMQRKIEESMHKSLENGDFKVYYQPKHDAVTGKLVGVEALIRWMHPEYGFMSPAEFIPLFEKNGFIVEIDKYVWKQTCKNLRMWAERGINTVPVSVNFSRLTLGVDGLLSKMQADVVENRLLPKQLHIEITETIMESDTDELIRKLATMRALGYQIELDDFGAGYSSINILSTLPLDVIKLDMSFMKQFGDEKRTKVLAACINLARELGYKTISEGVEEKEQCEMLGMLGVDFIQGYYFAKPMPEEEYEQYMKTASA